MIVVGQDALGGWAWMIIDRADRLVQAAQDLPDRFLAEQTARQAYAGLRHDYRNNLPAFPEVTVFQEPTP